ncbi:hypothetical protein Ancab_022420 [Ancistrocladus abbreviatus]
MKATAGSTLGIRCPQTKLRRWLVFTWPSTGVLGIPLKTSYFVPRSVNAQPRWRISFTKELAKGCYKDGAAGLAKYSMFRECNGWKFAKNSNLMRPGYYIGVDGRKQLVILGSCGTHMVYDLITDIVSSGDEAVTFEGYSTHFDTAEAGSLVSSS